jgi:hypothetical protein
MNHIGAHLRDGHSASVIDTSPFGFCGEVVGNTSRLIVLIPRRHLKLLQAGSGLEESQYLRIRHNL